MDAEKWQRKAAWIGYGSLAFIGISIASFLVWAIYFADGPREPDEPRAPVASPSRPSPPPDAAVFAPALADDTARPNESPPVRAKRIEARKRYLAFVSDSRISDVKEAKLRALLYAYQTQFYNARVANLMGTSDAGTAEEQIRGYKALDAMSVAALEALLSREEYELFMTRFRHPRALIVHKFFAQPENAP